MHFIKKIVRGLTAFGFGVWLLLTAGGFNWLNTGGRPATVKSWFADSGFYERGPEAFAAELAKDPRGGELPLNEPEIQSALKTAFSPAEIQKLTENFIDGFYSWLEGKAPEPDFRLDLNPPLDKFVANVADYAKRRLKALSACGRHNLPPPDADIFELECLPPRTDVDTEVAKWADQIKNNPNLGDNIITIEDLEDGQTSFEELADVPGVYQAMGWLPYLFAALALISAGLIVWLNDDKRHAWRVIGRSALIAGIVLLASAVVSRAIVGHLGKNKAAQDQFNTLGMPILKTATSDATRGQLWFGTVYSLGGAAAYIWLKKTAPKNTKTGKIT